MRIACPNCATEYDVPDRLLAGPGRMLRCSRCATDFALPLPDAAPPPDERPPPESPPPDRVSRRLEPRVDVPLVPLPQQEIEAALAAETGRALRLAWAVSLAVVAGGLVALVAFRGEVMAAWPPAARLFSALGLA